MSAYIQNYGITKTIIKDNKNKRTQNEVKWIGHYDGDIANIHIDINNNGNKKTQNINLNNTDIMNLLEIHSVEIPLDKRLRDDFLYKPITLALENRSTKNRSTKNRSTKKRSTKNRSTKKRSTKKRSTLGTNINY